MGKRLIRLTEQDLHRMVKESVQKILKEYNEPMDLSSDYNPYMNGDASWINGKYQGINGYWDVDINTSLSYVSIEGDGGEDYFLQGDEADELIYKIAKYWSDNDCDQEEAIGEVIGGLF